MTKQIRFGAVLILVAFLAACASTNKSGSQSSTDGTGAQTSGAGGQKSAKELEMEAQKAEDERRRQQMLSETVVYFQFDSSAVDDQARAVIEAHAAYLAKNPNVSVQLAGHCDERGTREYNLALGERRSQSVEKLMRAMGVTGNRIKTVSYGEEKPVDPGHDESAWRKNRRVELVYKR